MRVKSRDGKVVVVCGDSDVVIVSGGKVVVVRRGKKRRKGPRQAEGGGETQRTGGEILLDWLAGQPDGEASMTRLKRSGPRRFRGGENKEALQAAIEVVLDAGKVEVIHKRTSDRGPATAFVKLREPQWTDADEEASWTDAEALYEWLVGQPDGEATMRRLKWSGPRPLRGVENEETLQAAIDELVEAGKVAVTRQKPVNGGRDLVALRATGF